MGAFHTACIFLGIIGARFADAVLEDLLIESEVIAQGSITGVFEGKHYNRTVISHKIVMEALWRLQWKSFGNWLREKETSDADLKKVHDVVQSFRENRSKEDFEKLLDSLHMDKLNDSLVEFTRSDQGPMHAFWNSYIDIVNWLLLFIRWTRQANWDLHLACIQEMIPWVHVCDRINYTQYLPLYWAQMKALPTSHSEADTYLQNGGFAVQRSHASPFSQIPMDQTIEKTINRDTKTKGGIVGFSLNRGAVQRWMLTAQSSSDTESKEDDGN